jgi:hypothetical protein
MCGIKVRKDMKVKGRLLGMCKTERGGRRKYNRGGEYNQSILYSCVEMLS